jgi:hypothetical protein
MFQTYLVLLQSGYGSDNLLNYAEVLSQILHYLHFADLYQMVKNNEIITNCYKKCPRFIVAVGIDTLYMHGYSYPSSFAVTVHIFASSMAFFALVFLLPYLV